MKCIKLTYKSPLNGSVYCEGLTDADDNRVDFGPYGVLQLYNRDDKLLMVMTEHLEDLKDYVPDELKGFVVSAVFGNLLEENGKMYLSTEICVRNNPTDLQRDSIADWVTGQLSDGWGEGLEGDAVFVEDVVFTTTTFDEDTCEFVEEEQYHTARYYLHPWQYGPGWSVSLVSEEPVELDIPEDKTKDEEVLAEIYNLLSEILFKLESFK